MTLHSDIGSTINTVLVEDDIDQANFESETRLGEIGLDSLGFAVVIARLEKKLGFDPFTEGNIQSYPITFGEFVGIYENFSR